MTGASAMKEMSDEKEIKRGMDLISSLTEIMPERADERILPVYDDVRNTFRVPIVNFFFRVLANYPDYLVPAWNGFSPCLRTVKFERAADALRANALLDTVPDSSSVDWAALGDFSRIKPFTDTIHYILPKLLATAIAFHEDLGCAIRPGAAVPVDAGEEMPPGIVRGAVSISMIDPAHTKDQLGEIFEAIKTAHGHPEVATYYRSLAHWPRFLAAVWEKLAPVAGSPAYERHKQAVLEQALRTVETFTVKSSGTEAGISSPRQSAEIRAICAVFRFRLIPDLLLDVSLIKAMLDGPDAARVSRFSYHNDGVAHEQHRP